MKAFFKVAFRSKTQQKFHETPKFKKIFDRTKQNL